MINGNILVEDGINKKEYNPNLGDSKQIGNVKITVCAINSKTGDNIESFSEPLFEKSNVPDWLINNIDNNEHL